MARKGKISQLYDLDAIQKQQDNVIAMIAQLVDTISGVKPMQLKLEGADKFKDIIEGTKAIGTATQKVAEGTTQYSKSYGDLLSKVKQGSTTFGDQKLILDKFGSSLEDNINRQLQYKLRLQEIAADLKNLQQFEGLGEGAEKVRNEIAALTKEQYQLKQSNSEVTQTIKAQIKEQEAEAGSMDEIAAKLGLLRDLRRKLASVDRESPFGQELQKDIDKLDVEIKELDAQSGQYFRNVGNYAGSLSPLFSKLQEQLAKLKEQQQGMRGPVGVQDLTGQPQQTQSWKQVEGFKVGQSDKNIEAVTSAIYALEKAQQVGFKTGASYAQQIVVIEKSLEDLSRNGSVPKEFIEELTKMLAEAKGTRSFSDALKVLKKEASDVKAKVDALTASGLENTDAFQKLKTEYDLLNQVTANQGAGYVSMRQEIMANQIIIEQLTATYGEDAEIVKKLTKENGKLRDSFKDLKATQNAVGSDTFAFDALLQGGQALVGLYTSAQGAAALFGDENEDLQKTFVKLQASMALVQGVQTVVNALQKESALIQGIYAAKTKVATIAQGIFTAVVGGSTGALKAFRIAIASTGVGLLLIGLGILVSKLMSATSVTNSFTEAQKDLAKSLAESSDRIKKQIDAIGDNYKNSLEALRKDLDLAEKSGASREVLFAKKKAIAAAEKKLADEKLAAMIKEAEKDKFIVQSGLSGMDALLEARTTYGTLYVANLNTLKNAQDDFNKATLKGDDTEDLEKNITEIKQRVSDYKTIYDNYASIIDGAFTAQKNSEEVAVEESKFNADERRKLVLETTKLEASAIIDKNTAILSSERSMLKERTAALDNIAAQQKRIAEAEKNNVISDPGTSRVDRLLAVKKYNAEIQKINKDTKQKTLEEEEKFALRESAAQARVQEINKVQLVNFYKEMVAETRYGLDQRLDALQKATNLEKDLAENEFNLKLKQAGISDKEIAELKKNRDFKVQSKKITDEELRALQAEHEDRLLNIVIGANNTTNDVLVSNLQKQKALHEEGLMDIQRLYERTDLSSLEQYSAEVIALNKSLSDRKISLEKYNREREQIDLKYQKTASRNLIKSLEDQLKLFTVAEERELDAKKRVEDLKLQLAGATTDQQKKEISDKLVVAEQDLKIAKDLVDTKVDLQKKLANATKEASDDSTERQKENIKKLQDTYKQLANEIKDTFFDVLAGQIDREKNAIQKQIDLIEIKKQKEIEAANSTMASAEEKAATIAIIEARAQSQREALERRQRALDNQKARFERQQMIAGIVGNTAQGVTAALTKKPPDVALAVAVGAIGAVQLIRALATPIPQYEHGTEDHPGGLAVVGEKRKEYVKTPDGNYFQTPAKPTLINLPAHSQVFKDDIEFMNHLHEKYAANTEKTMSKTNPELYQFSNMTNQLGTIGNKLDHLGNRFEGAIKKIPQPIYEGKSGLLRWVHGNGSSTNYV